MLSVLEVFTIFDMDYEGKSFDEASTQKNRIGSSDFDAGHWERRRDYTA